MLMAGAFLCAASLYAEADGSWLKHVPDADRTRANPFAGQADAVSAGREIYQDRCKKCHGDDGEGRGKKPTLRSSRVQNATDGEIFWLLKNGNRAKGMPTWSAMPDQMRWQVITYVKSLGKSGLFSYSVGTATGTGVWK
jgi:mono/diheme cytochrome c family protein